MTTYTTTETPPRATIIPFPRKRGRPRIQRAQHDTGTPELVMKRLKQETAEALDLCLERGIITAEQHWCGIHLRWLYTLRYGAPGVRAIDPSHFGGKETKLDDPEWRTAREKEFTEAVEKLSRYRHAHILIAVCIYNERPNFLHAPVSITRARMEKNSREIAKFCEGLDMLVEYWQR